MLDASSFDHTEITVASVGDTLHYSAFDPPRAGKGGGLVTIAIYANGAVTFMLDKKLSRFPIAAPNADAALERIRELYLGYRAERAKGSATANLAVANGAKNREAKIVAAVSAATAERDAAIASAVAEYVAAIAELRRDMANERANAEMIRGELSATVERLTAELATATEQLASAPSRKRAA